MKMQPKALLLFTGCLFIGLTGFRSAEWKKMVKSGPTAVNIEFVYSSTPTSPGAYSGNFTAVGGIDASGTSIMTVDFFGNVAHCVQVLTDGAGTITINSYCEFSTMHGSWHVVDATGAYAGLKGNGRLLMGFPGGGIITESFNGKVQ